MLSILQACNTSNIKNLSIGKYFYYVGANNYGVSFYREFSKMDFSSLVFLDLNALLIDEYGIAEMINMRFPSLEYLNI